MVESQVKSEKPTPFMPTFDELGRVGGWKVAKIDPTTPNRRGRPSDIQMWMKATEYENWAEFCQANKIGGSKGRERMERNIQNAKELAEVMAKRYRQEFELISIEFKKQAEYINMLEERIEKLEKAEEQGRKGQL